MGIRLKILVKQSKEIDNRNDWKNLKGIRIINIDIVHVRKWIIKHRLNILPRIL